VKSKNWKIGRSHKIAFTKTENQSDTKYRPTKPQLRTARRWSNTKREVAVPQPPGIFGRQNRPNMCYPTTKHDFKNFGSIARLRAWAVVSQACAERRCFGRKLDGRALGRAFKMVSQGLQTSLSEGHITYYTAVRGPDVLRNVIVSRYITFYQINKCFANI